MKKSLPAAFLLALMSASMANPGCATVKPVAAPVLTKITHGIDCAKDKIVQQLPNIIVDVLTDVISKDWSNLALLGEDDTVVCAVGTVVSSAMQRRASATAASPNADTAILNGQAYLAERDVHFIEPATTTMGSIGGCTPACDACHQCNFYPPPNGSLHGVYACAPRSPKPLGC